MPVLGGNTTLGGAGLPSTVVTKTAAYTAAPLELVQADASAGAFSVTLPANPAVGSIVTVQKIDAAAGAITVVPSGGGTIDGGANVSLTKRWATVGVEHLGANVWMQVFLIGNTAAAAAAYALDVVPTAPHAKDDEFAAATLDAKWTPNLIGGVQPFNAVIAGGAVTLVPTVASKHGYLLRQVAPPGSFTIMAKVYHPGYAVGDMRPGIFVARTANSQATVYGCGTSGGPAKCMWISHLNYSETADWGGYDGSWSSNQGGSYDGGPAWYRMVYNATTSVLSMAMSTDGFRWHSVAGLTRTGYAQPDRIGIVMENNSGDQPVSDVSEFTCEWFRVTEP